jgi:hypothetical protein
MAQVSTLSASTSPSQKTSAGFLAKQLMGNCAIWSATTQHRAQLTVKGPGSQPHLATPRATTALASSLTDTLSPHQQLTMAVNAKLTMALPLL